MNINPKRGEIWLINLDPTIGAEIKKTRPAVVVNSDYIGKLPLKLVVPITNWGHKNSELRIQNSELNKRRKNEVWVKIC